MAAEVMMLIFASVFWLGGIWAMVQDRLGGAMLCFAMGMGLTAGCLLRLG